MSFKKTILQRMLIEADAVVELVHVDSSKLERGCEAVDLKPDNFAGRCARFAWQARWSRV